MNRFRGIPDKSAKVINNFNNRYSNQPQQQPRISNPKLVPPKNNNKVFDVFDGIDDGIIDIFDDKPKKQNRDIDFYDEIYSPQIQPAQRPESFHHFILENQYKDLERSIRGFKDVYNKDTQKWELKRKDLHCFTDAEAEDILRTAQSHLATDIKLGYISKDAIGLYMNALYKEIAFLFETIAEYRYGRYGNSDIQYEMKVQNQKIFLELWTRIQANYSRAIGGMENRYTHDSVKGQESLQQGDRFLDNRRFYS